MASIAPSRIAQIAIPVRDLERAKSFYGEALALTHLFDAPPGLAFYQCGETRLMLSPPEKAEFDHPSSILYFKVDDIQAAHKRLMHQNVKMEDKPHLVARMPDHELWLNEFRDSENNLMCLMSEVR